MASTLYFDSASITRPPFFGDGQWILKELKPITILFGKNGSGKSFLLRTWRDFQPQSIHYIVPERTGTINFEAGYLQRQTTPEERRNQSTFNYVDGYRQQVIARIQHFFMKRGGSRENKLPGNIDVMENLLATILTDFDIKLSADSPPYRIRRLSDNSEIRDVNQLSSGEAQVLTLGIDILTIAAIWDIENISKRLILIDEPDAHIHPDLQARFADFLVQVANRYSLQVVIATHSTTLLSALGQFGGQDCGVIYLNRTSKEFEAKSFSNVYKEVAACLGGHALMGPLFGVPLLLVEGDDDYRVWSQVPRHHITQFAVIPCGGSTIQAYQKSLEQIFSSLLPNGSDPVAYALLDGDKPLPKPNPQSTQDFVPYIRLNCHETENLYLSDQVLKFIGTDWDTAKHDIMTRSSQFGTKSQQLANVTNWDRQREDIKQVIHEIAEIIDPKRIMWAHRLGHAIGSEKPTGQLADFLGEDVVQKLWPS